jgi:hypothetical protein
MPDPTPPGESFPFERDTPATPCRFSGCPDPAVSHGWCAFHVIPPPGLVSRSAEGFITAAGITPPPVAPAPGNPPTKKCEACGLISVTAEYVYVRTVNGGLNLCRWCLDQINAKAPKNAPPAAAPAGPGDAGPDKDDAELRRSRERNRATILHAGNCPDCDGQPEMVALSGTALWCRNCGSAYQTELRLHHHADARGRLAAAERDWKVWHDRAGEAEDQYHAKSEEAEQLRAENARLAAERDAFAAGVDALHAEAAAGAEAMRAERDWREIETAPKDGTHVLASVPFDTGYRYIFEAWWSDLDAGGWLFAVGCGPVSEVGDPTHWMPVPPGPAAGAKGDTP